MAWKVVQIITANGTAAGMIVYELDEVFDSENAARTAAQRENMKLEDTKYIWKHVEFEE